MPKLSTPYAFPFCISDAEEDEVGPGTDYPFGVTWEQLFEIYYRIKEAGLYFAITLTDINDPPEEISANGELGNARMSGSYSNVEGSESYVGIETEDELRCHKATSIQWEGVIPPDDVYFPIFIGMFSEVKKKDDLYWPQFFLTFDGVAGQFWVSTKQDEVHITAVEDVLKVFGQEVTIYHNDGTASILGEIEVYGSKWWTHDPEDGLGPVWDENTGAELRDPFSVQP